MYLLTVRTVLGWKVTQSRSLPTHRHGDALSCFVERRLGYNDHHPTTPSGPGALPLIVAFVSVHRKTSGDQEMYLKEPSTSQNIACIHSPRGLLPSSTEAQMQSIGCHRRPGRFQSSQVRHQVRSCRHFVLYARSCHGYQSCRCYLRPLITAAGDTRFAVEPIALNLIRCCPFFTL